MNQNQGYNVVDSIAGVKYFYHCLIYLQQPHHRSPYSRWTPPNHTIVIPLKRIDFNTQLLIEQNKHLPPQGRNQRVAFYVQRTWLDVGRLWLWLWNRRVSLVSPYSWASPCDASEWGSHPDPALTSSVERWWVDAVTQAIVGRAHISLAGTE